MLIPQENLVISASDDKDSILNLNFWAGTVKKLIYIYIQAIPARKFVQAGLTAWHGMAVFVTLTKQETSISCVNFPQKAIIFQIRSQLALVEYCMF